MLYFVLITIHMLVMLNVPLSEENLLRKIFIDLINVSENNHGSP